MVERQPPPSQSSRVPTSYTVHPAVLARMLMHHYDTTYALTEKASRQRNIMYLLLVVLVFGNVLLMLWPDATTPLILQVAARAAGVPGLAQLAQPAQLLSFEVLQTLLLVSGFLLIANLFQQNSVLDRNYRYMSALEHDLRLLVDLPTGGLAFTRETDAYRALRDPPGPWLRRAYLGILAALIFLLSAPILYFAIVRTFAASGTVLVANLFLLAGDIVIVVLMVAVLWADVRRAIHFGPVHVAAEAPSP